MNEKTNHSVIRLTLPNGQTIEARINDDPDCPSIDIYLLQSNQPENLLCSAEFNREMTEGNELCIGAYMSHSDEPAYYDSYQNSEKKNLFQLIYCRKRDISQD